MQAARVPAPDLFEALEIEPLPPPAGVPEVVVDVGSSAPTGPLRVDQGPLPPPGGVAGIEGEPVGLADLLEPPTDAPTARHGAAGETGEPLELAAREEEASLGVSDGLADEPAGARGGGAWGWAALTVIFAGTLGWVLWTQTDLFQGDLVARRRAEAAKRAQEQLERAQAQAAAQARRYGTIKIDADPKGSRVFLVKPGPVARFEGLAADGAYVVLAMAPGRAPEARRVAGEELRAAVQLDPPPARTAVVEIPDPGPPEPGTSSDLVTLEVRTKAPGATLGLLIGYTPGAGMADVDVDVPHRFLVAAPGHLPEEILVEPGDYQDLEAGPVFTTHLQLAPVAGEPAGGTGGGGAESAGTTTGGRGTAGLAGEPAGKAAPPDARAAAPKASKKKRRRRSRRRKRRSKRRKRR